ncbi:MAG: hypothetical protein IPO31_23490 [Candidatus Obscuribacter sp.]|nr:hypothetical protein [Candidatus Obscuribacter sp.]
MPVNWIIAFDGAQCRSHRGRRSVHHWVDHRQPPARLAALLLPGGVLRAAKEQKSTKAALALASGVVTIAAFALLLPAAAVHHVGTPDSQLSDSKWRWPSPIVLMMLTRRAGSSASRHRSTWLAPVADIPEDTHSAGLPAGA